MTSRSATCPNCGAAVVFLWSAAVQTTCQFCRSILVRHDVNLEKVGLVGDLPPDASPIQRGTEGRWGARPFIVVGRIIYEYQRGYWSEWHVRFSDGASGWLSDAQLEFTFSVLETPQGALLASDEIRPGSIIAHGGERYQATTVTRARYRGVEGELPFEYWDKDETVFVDLSTAGGRFATIDYSENPPLMFVGEHVQFAELSLRELRQFEGWPPPA